MEILTIVMELDKPDGEILYPSEVITPAVLEFNKIIRKNNDGILGEWSPPKKGSTVERSFSIDLQRVSHIVKHIFIEGKTVKAKLKLVGKYAELGALGIDFTVVPRLLGKVTEGVAEKIQFVTLDLAYIVEE